MKIRCSEGSAVGLEIEIPSPAKGERYFHPDYPGEPYEFIPADQGLPPLLVCVPSKGAWAE